MRSKLFHQTLISGIDEGDILTEFELIETISWTNRHTIATAVKPPSMIGRNIRPEAPKFR
jgi:hypothetical protein